ncbi:NmrA domain-containing protein [Mycena sanguinolenta]|uniref:NmrA domain-containing protein n=1 Tax=Mycena sanguinolenta TaxID=230812 RepID=A0A8H7D6V5_9AGAR|nr:NmrA domain-containing protein [Mycena sanguinolenta]
MTSRVVSVFGATGLQGGAVVDALLKDGTFVPRAITRDPESEASKKLKARGVEVVKADSIDKASLVAALRGSEAVFAVTLPVIPKTEGKGEDVQGKNIVDAAKEAGVKFFIWTSLPSLSEYTNGKYKNAIHFEDKQIVHDYLRSSGLAHATLLLPGFLENLWNLGNLKKTATGYTIAAPSFNATNIQDFIWIARDVPAAALALLRNYADPTKQVNGKTYSVVSVRLSYGKLAELTAKALGVEVTYTTGPPTGLLPVDEMWDALAEFGWYTSDTPAPNPDLVALGAKFSTVEDFLEAEVKPRFGN